MPMPTPLTIARVAILGLSLGSTSIAPAEAPKHSDFMQAMHASMSRMMKDMDQAAMTGDPDHDFLAMMIPHHAGAVEMARIELMYGRDPLVRRLAEEVLASQQSEIAAMQARLKVIKSRKQGDPAEYPSPYGLRGEENDKNR